MSIPSEDAFDDREAFVVEGEAVELAGEPATSGAQPPAGAPIRPVYEPEPYEARAYASSVPAASRAAGGRGWPEPGIDLSERPEIVVGAAFGGGLLLALILRKLGR